MERLFVLKTLSRTQRATKVKIFVGFSLKPLRCRDPALPPLYGCVQSAIFPCVFSCTRMRISRVYTRMIHRRGFSTLVLFISGCSHFRVSSFQGVLISGCPHFRVSPFQGVPISGCPHFRVSPFQNVLISGCSHFRVSSFQGVLISGCPHFRVSSFQGVLIRGVHCVNLHFCVSHIFSVPDITIATDIICGFPTETEEVC